MTWVVFGFVAVVAAIFVSVVLGKKIDKKEYVGIKRGKEECDCGENEVKN